MFWAGGVPAVLFFILSFFIPESPRFLGKTGKWDSAGHILTKIGGKSYAADEKSAIRESLVHASERVEWKNLLAKEVRPVLIIGVFLAVF